MFEVKYANETEGWFAISCTHPTIYEIDAMIFAAIGNNVIEDAIETINHARHVIDGFLENAHLQNCSYVAFRFVVNG